MESPNNQALKFNFAAELSPHDDSRAQCFLTPRWGQSPAAPPVLLSPVPTSVRAPSPPLLPPLVLSMSHLKSSMVSWRRVPRDWRASRPSSAPPEGTYATTSFTRVSCGPSASKFTMPALGVTDMLLHAM